MTIYTFYYPSDYGAAFTDNNGGAGSQTVPANSLQYPDGYTILRVDTSNPGTYSIIVGFDSAYATNGPQQYTVTQTAYHDASHNEVVTTDGSTDFFLQNTPYNNTGYTFPAANTGAAFQPDTTKTTPPSPVENFAHDYGVFKNPDGSFSLYGGDYGAQMVEDYRDPGAGSDNLAQIGDISTDHFAGISQSSGGLTKFTYVGKTANGGIVGGYTGYYGGTYYSLLTNRTYTTSDTINTSAQPAVICFASGTLIRTLRGDISVEALRVGDLAMTASGTPRPIRWIGHRTIECRTQAQPRDVWPIRVAANAFGDGLPATDLFMSAGHAVRVGVMDHVLIPIGKLINGATITRHPVDMVTYWHVELDSHDVLVANGLPAESFLDCGNRSSLLEQAGDYERAAGPHTPADFCLPFVEDGEVLASVRSLLAAQATRLGWTMTHDMDMHLMVDGRRVEPDIDGEIARFFFPAAAKSVVLASLAQTPSDAAPVFDDRRLGLSLHRLEIADGLHVHHDLVAGDARLAPLLHPEADAGRHHRFTTGRMDLPPALWAGCRTQAMLRVHHDPRGGTRWLAPAAPKDEMRAPQRAFG